jgi:hypothetical protein
MLVLTTVFGDTRLTVPKLSWSFLRKPGPREKNPSSGDGRKKGEEDDCEEKEQRTRVTGNLKHRHRILA